MAVEGGRKAPGAPQAPPARRAPAACAELDRQGSTHLDRSIGQQPPSQLHTRLLSVHALHGGGQASTQAAVCEQLTAWLLPALRCRKAQPRPSSHTQPTPSPPDGSVHHRDELVGAAELARAAVAAGGVECGAGREGPAAGPGKFLLSEGPPSTAPQPRPPPALLCTAHSALTVMGGLAAAGAGLEAERAGAACR